MDQQNTSTLIGAGIALVSVTAPLFVASRRETHRARAEARASNVRALEALMRDAQEIRFNLSVFQNQWTGWRVIAPQLAQALAHAASGYTQGKPFAGIADGFAAATAWKRGEFDSHMALLVQPLQRLGATLAHVATLPEAQLREAANRVGVAVGGLAEVAVSRPGSEKRKAAEEEFDAAIRELGETMRAHAQPAKPQFRAGKSQRATSSHAHESSATDS